MMIRECSPDDAASIAKIYNHYIRTSTATFETEDVSSEEMKQRIIGVMKKYPWIVFEENEVIMGYSYATKWKDRMAYDNTVELTTYIDQGHTGKKTGKILLEGLITGLKENNFHCLIAGIALPNDVSIRLHEGFGFEKCSHFKEVGFKFGKWIDVAHWQLIL